MAFDSTERRLAEPRYRASATACSAIRRWPGAVIPGHLKAIAPLCFALA